MVVVAHKLIEGSLFECTRRSDLPCICPISIMDLSAILILMIVVQISPNGWRKTIYYRTVGIHIKIIVQVAVLQLIRY